MLEVDNRGLIKIHKKQSIIGSLSAHFKINIDMKNVKLVHTENKANATYFNVIFYYYFVSSLFAIRLGENRPLVFKNMHYIGNLSKQVLVLFWISCVLYLQVIQIYSPFFCKASSNIQFQVYIMRLYRITERERKSGRRERTQTNQT